ncbi:MAG TPA: hypothetical protein VM925_22290 [Labilithrix sp.]|nr:hypothetical protein [Labilithrix sp.]
MDRFVARALSLTSVVLLALLSARLIAHDIRFAAVVVFVAAALLVPAWLARRRMRTLLLSGDIKRILVTWQSSFRRVTHPETMAPLVTATAYAAYGFIDRARDSLSRAAKGPAWEAAVEQRLFVEALLDVYEGERSRALTKAEELEKLPLPNVGFWMRRKIALLRRGVGALARAFAHSSRVADEALLRDAARSSPLVHWAMRYARAVYLVDAGRQGEARTLLADAPSWPEESAFRSFHDELTAQLAP